MREALGVDCGCGISSNDSFRVWRNGTVRGGAIRESSAFELRFVAVVAVFWLMRLSTREDLLRLWRDVRLSSSGFMSGGSLEILRKMTAR